MKLGKEFLETVANMNIPKPQTNADRIRSMTDEELADFINDTEFGFIDRPGMCDICDNDSVQNCGECWLDWLKSPVEEG